MLHEAERALPWQAGCHASVLHRCPQHRSALRSVSQQSHSSLSRLILHACSFGDAASSHCSEQLVQAATDMHRQSCKAGRTALSLAAVPLFALAPDLARVQLATLLASLLGAAGAGCRRHAPPEMQGRSHRAQSRSSPTPRSHA